MLIKIKMLFQTLIVTVSPWIPVIGTVLFCYISYNIISFIMGIMATKKIIKRKQEEREAQFKKLEGQSRYQLNEKHNQILALKDEELIQKLQSKKLTACEVQEAFIAKALKVTRKLNTVTEFVPQAEAWAKELDTMNGVKGPLHGFPISVKDNCNVKGMDSTLGLGKFLFKPVEESAAIIKSLMELGAVPFVKTNVPQTLLSFGCANPVFGLTKNFLNEKLSPGGSSGGESSLIAAGGSRLGIGSDIGGSVRIPAAFTGITGFKVTKNRFSGIGYRGSLPNVVGLMGVPGLLADDVNMLVTATKHMVNNNLQNKYDPLALPIPWNEEMFSGKKKLRIGYFTSLSYFPLIGDTEDVVLKAKSALESQGHTLVPFEMPDSFDMMNLVFDFCFADAGEFLLKNWLHEPIPLSVIVNFLICKSPFWVRKIIVLIMGCHWMPFLHSRRAVTIIGRGANKTTDLWDRMGTRKTMTENLLTSWKKAKIDLLLTPTYPFPAVPHHMPGRLQPSVIYTMIWNLFDFPAGVLKFGIESGKKVDNYDCENDMVLRTGKQGAKQATGMPISVQIVGLPYQEELVLRGMVELNSVSPYK